MLNVTKYTFPNGARLYTRRRPGGCGIGARFGPPFMPDSQSNEITRAQAAKALLDARRQGLNLHVVRWQAG